MAKAHGTFSLRIAGGGGFCTPVGTVRSIEPAKKREHSIVTIAWSRKHGTHYTGSERVNRIVAVGDYRKLRKRWKALLAANEG